MATITKTFKENEQSSYQSTWTVSITGTDQTVSGNFTLAMPTITAKYVYSGKTKGTVDISLNASIGGANALYARPIGGGYAAMTSGTNYSISRTGAYGTAITLSSIFNANNKTSKTVDVNISSDTYGIFLRSSNADESMDRSYSNSAKYTWGKIATITLNAPPTFTVSNAASDTDGFYAGISTARVTLSSCSAKYGGTITQTKLTIGNQTVTGTGNGTLSIKLNTAGTFTPTVTVTDSRGQVTTKQLAAITVNPYIVPQAAISSAERTTAAGIPNDEGTSAVVTAVFTYTDAISDLEEPLVKINGAIKPYDFCTWYEQRAADGTLSNPVDWDGYCPPSPVTLYGLMTEPFDEELSYVIGITPGDDYETGQETTQTLPQAYYTMDVYAGGHGIAFGAPATEDGFKVAMSALFTSDVIFKKMAGVIQMFAGAASPPAGWLFCRGQAVSRTDYADLFAVIGTTFGTGDGSTTFNLPDMRDRFPVGVGSAYALNAKGGAASVTLTTNQIPAHTHGKSGAISGGITSSGAHTHTFKTQADYAAKGTKKGIYSESDGTWSGTSVMTSTGAHTHNLPAHEHTSVGGGQAHENRPPYIGINFIICTGKL